MKTQTTPEFQSIAWHTQCHKNRLSSLVAKKEQLRRLQSEIKRDEDEIEFYTKQINAAVARGLKKFDATRLLRGKHAKA